MFLFCGMKHRSPDIEKFEGTGFENADIKNFENFEKFFLFK